MYSRVWEDARKIHSGLSDVSNLENLILTSVRKLLIRTICTRTKHTKSSVDPSGTNRVVNMKA